MRWHETLQVQTVWAAGDTKGVVVAESDPYFPQLQPHPQHAYRSEARKPPPNAQSAQVVAQRLNQRQRPPAFFEENAP